MTNLTTSAATTGTFWTRTPEALSAAVGCGARRLESDKAARKLISYGPNSDAETKNAGLGRAAFGRLLEPFSLILIAAGIVSIATCDAIGGSIIAAILAVSIGLHIVQEGQVVRAAEILSQSVALKAEVKRDGMFSTVDVDKVVPGDVSVSAPGISSQPLARPAQVRPSRRAKQS